MLYTSIENLKSYLGITDTSRDDELTALIETATEMVDIELGYNLGKEDAIVIRVNGMGTKRVVLPQKVNSVSKVEVKDTGNSTWREIDQDFIDGIVLYLIEEVAKGVKNVAVTCSRGYDAVPADFERWFLSYCAILIQKQEQDTEWQIQNKKLDGLSITYFAPSEFDGNQDIVGFQKLLKHYKSFSF